MFRIKLSATGIAPFAGARVASDIEEEFHAHRMWHHDVSCIFIDGNLILTAKNDCDPHGLALMDEFSDCICAYVSNDDRLPLDGDIQLLSVEHI
jgi:hypothetical protein